MSRDTHYAKSGDVHIAYQVIGAGPVDLVLVPGFVSNVEDWWEEPTCVRFFDRLTSFSRLILFDKRGTGRSDRVAQTPSMEQRVDDIRAVLDAVGSQRAALLGISEGGALATVFAATHPQRTSALVLYATIAAFISWIPTAEELQHVLESIDRTWGTGTSLPRYAPSMAGNKRFRRWWARHEREGGSPGTVMDLMRMNSEIDIRPILPAVRVPTLVLHRVNDAAVDVESGRQLWRDIPGAQYVELPGSDHVPWVGNADAILDEIEEFVTGVRPAATVDCVLATILVADVAGATRLAIELGEQAWLDLLDSFRNVTAKQIARFQGRTLEEVGTRVVAAFDGPARAVRAACAIADDAVELGVQVKAGLHTGEIRLNREGAAGIAVQIAAWIAELAAADEVLVASTVKDLVSGSGLGFEDRGLYTVKVGQEQWRLFRVTRAAGPSPAAPAAVPAGELTAREREVALLLVGGLTNRQIANALTITEGTAAQHVKHVMAKLGFSSRSQVAVWATRQGLNGQAAGQDIQP